MTEPPPDGGWDPQADWEAQVKAAREARAAPVLEKQPGAAAAAAQSGAAAAAAQSGAAGAAQAGAAPEAGASGDAETGYGVLAEIPPGLPGPGRPGQAVTVVAEPDVPAQTVPLVPFTPFVAPLAPAVPVTGLDAGQAGLAVATARASAGQGMTGILGQDHLRTDVMPLRFLSPRLALGRRHRWWLWRAGSAAAAARPAMVIYGPTVPWIVVRISGVDVFCGRRLRRYLRREASSRSGYLDERQIAAICEIAAQVLPPAV